VSRRGRRGSGREQRGRAEANRRRIAEAIRQAGESVLIVDLHVEHSRELLHVGDQCLRNAVGLTAVATCTRQINADRAILTDDAGVAVKAVG